MRRSTVTINHSKELPLAQGIKFDDHILSACCHRPTHREDKPALKCRAQQLEYPPPLFCVWEVAHSRESHSIVRSTRTGVLGSLDARCNAGEHTNSNDGLDSTLSLEV
uniref:(California timema) hypothetical protein n=1 Tax=Timema californicum TaxID=61474 RepID=A0A7R9PAP3_TIMCA|nr:unnamed protein product [Timema californicum]